MKKIILKNISKKYGDRIIIDDLSLEIEEGKIITFTGKSGVGKTTLLNIIGQLDYDYEGELYIDKQLVKKNDKERLELYRNKIGFVFQNYALIDNMSIKENLQIAMKFSKNKANEIENVLKQVGIDNDINKKVYTLSGGEQQRVAIARLLIKPCDIILADEPTGSLDKECKQEIIKLFKYLNSLGKTILIVTHDDEVVQNSDDHYIL
ncbi:MAG: ATP-binding cassette domain-containing protein [Erysipelotrichia bacterium]|nr:ATP-binding cassette domain-containing protein [Erysipelotrichia bacterium]